MRRKDIYQKKWTKSYIHHLHQTHFHTQFPASDQMLHISYCGRNSRIALEITTLTGLEGSSSVSFFTTSFFNVTVMNGSAGMLVDLLHNTLC